MIGPLPGTEAVFLSVGGVKIWDETRPIGGKEEIVGARMRKYPDQSEK